MLDQDGHLLLAPRIGFELMPDLSRRPLVHDAPDLSLVARQHAGGHRHDAHADPQLLAHELLQLARLPTPGKLDLDLDLVHPAALGVERDAESPRSPGATGRRSVSTISHTNSWS